MESCARDFVGMQKDCAEWKKRLDRRQNVCVAYFNNLFVLRIGINEKKTDILSQVHAVAHSHSNSM